MILFGSAILTKGNMYLQMRSISNVMQFGVDSRKTLFLLLLLFAIPADDCSAQTPPPPVDEHAFERVPPTVVKRLATRFSLGAFAGRFEETPLGAVPTDREFIEHFRNHVAVRCLSIHVARPPARVHQDDRRTGTRSYLS